MPSLGASANAPERERARSARALPRPVASPSVDDDPEGPGARRKGRRRRRELLQGAVVRRRTRSPCRRRCRRPRASGRRARAARPRRPRRPGRAACCRRAPGRPRRRSRSARCVLLAVLTVNRKWPSRLISTQHGAVWKSGNGDAPIEVSVPSAATSKAETVPLPAPSWAFDTKTWRGFVGRNSLPNGPGPWAANGRAGRGGQAPVEADREAVDHRRVHPHAEQVRPGRVEEDVAGLRVVRQRDGRAGERPQAVAPRR